MVNGEQPSLALPDLKTISESINKNNNDLMELSGQVKGGVLNKTLLHRCTYKAYYSIEYLKAFLHLFKNTDKLLEVVHILERECSFLMFFHSETLNPFIHALLDEKRLAHLKDGFDAIKSKDSSGESSFIKFISEEEINFEKTLILPILGFIDSVLLTTQSLRFTTYQDRALTNQALVFNCVDSLDPIDFNSPPVQKNHDKEINLLSINNYGGAYYGSSHSRLH